MSGTGHSDHRGWGKDNLVHRANPVKVVNLGIFIGWSRWCWYWRSSCTRTKHRRDGSTSSGATKKCWQYTRSYPRPVCRMDQSKTTGCRLEKRSSASCKISSKYTKSAHRKKDKRYFRWMRQMMSTSNICRCSCLPCPI